MRKWKIMVAFLCLLPVKQAAAQIFAITDDPKYLSREVAFRQRISKEILITYYVHNNRSDSVISKELYYDSAGKVIEVRTFSGGRFAHRFVYMYSGDRLTSVFEDGMGQGYKMDYKVTYDSSGKPYEEHRQIQGKPYFVIFRYLFDSTGVLTGINRSFNGDPFEPFLRYYYERGRLTRTEEYANPERLAFTALYKYEIDGSVSKYYLIGRQKLKAEVSFFSKSGQMTKRVLYYGEPSAGFLPRIHPDGAVRYYEYNPDKTIAAIHFGNRRKVKGRTVYNYFQ